MAEDEHPNDSEAAGEPGDGRADDDAAPGAGDGTPGGDTGDSASIDAALERLTAAWPTPELTDAQRDVYQDVLSDVPGPALSAAVEGLLREGREERPPPGLLRERALAPAPGSGITRWLAPVALAVAVALAVLAVVLVLRGGEDEPAEGLPQTERIEELLGDWDWQAGLATQSVGCERITEDRAECVVLFTTGDRRRVAVLPGDDPGELVIDVADDEGTGTAP